MDISNDCDRGGKPGDVLFILEDLLNLVANKLDCNLIEDLTLSRSLQESIDVERVLRHF